MGPVRAQLAALAVVAGLTTGLAGQKPAAPASHAPRTLFGWKARDTQPPSAGKNRAGSASSRNGALPRQLVFDVRVVPAAVEPLAGAPPVRVALNANGEKAVRTRYGILFAIPASQVAFKADGQGMLNGSVEFDVMAFDAAGRVVATHSEQIPLPLTVSGHEEFLRTPFKFYQEIDLPAGEIKVRADILDRTSNKLGTLEIPLTVGQPADSGGGG